MKPPCCACCGSERSPCVLIEFANYEPLADGLCGHPAGLEWFCPAHEAVARTLTAFSADDALATMRGPRGFRP